MAALSVAYLSGFTFASISPRNLTTFSDYTGADPVIKKFTLNIDDDVAKDAGGSGTDSAIKTDSDDAEGQAQQQAQNADGGTLQADAIDDAGAKTTAVGDPPAGTEQQQ